MTSVQTVPDARQATIAASFRAKDNSLNFLRLALAVTVIASHAIFFWGHGTDWIGNKTTIGSLAVYGFFGISGFLIAGSAERNGIGRYLWLRALRIFPAFWVCLIVTAFGFALVGWQRELNHYGLNGTVSQYMHLANGPVGYVTNNWFLKLRQYFIGTTDWNASIWSLYYEFLCYLILGGLALFGILRRRRLVLGLWAATWVWEFVATAVPRVNHHVSVGVQGNRLTVLVPVFLTGAVIHLYQDRILDTAWLALASTGVVVASLWMPIGASIPFFTLTSTGLFAVFIVYPMIWLGIHLPLQRLGSKNDYSYGVYIYAFPVQSLLTLWGVALWGYVPFVLMGILCTVPFAVASWWLVERPALKLRKWSPITFGPREPPPEEIASDGFRSDF